jgi:hypothetical protein
MEYVLVQVQIKRASDVSSSQSPTLKARIASGLNVKTVRRRERVLSYSVFYSLRVLSHGKGISFSPLIQMLNSSRNTLITHPELTTKEPTQRRG